MNPLPASFLMGQLVDANWAGRSSTAISMDVEDRRIVASGRHFTMDEKVYRNSPPVWIATLFGGKVPHDRLAAPTTSEDVRS